MFIGPEKSGNAYDWDSQEAFFLDFAQAIRPHLSGTVPLLLTGGFRSCNAMETAVKRGDCDMVGLARPAVVNPLLPRTVVFNPEVNKNGDTKLHATRTPAPWYIKLFGITALNVHMDNVSNVGTKKTPTPRSNSFIGMVCGSTTDVGKDWALKNEGKKIDRLKHAK